MKAIGFSVLLNKEQVRTFSYSISTCFKQE